MVLAHDTSNGERTLDIKISHNVTFDTLLLSKSTLDGLKNAGFRRPSPIQLHGIPLGKCGFDLLLEAKSGTGKTAVFTVIALEKLDLSKGLQTIILAPTREIASQICDVVKEIGSQYEDLSVEVVMGGLSIKEDIEKFQKGRKVHILVGSPGRLKHLIQDKYVDTSSVRLLVLDEADKLMEKSFQADINYIFSTLPHQKQVIMSSATYAGSCKEFISKYVDNAQHICPDTTSILLGIEQKVTTVISHVNIVKQTQLRYEELIKIMTKKQFKQCLVFCNYQARVSELHNMLTRDKWPSEHLYGQQQQTDRLDALKTLQEFKCRILISTDLAARGIDASNVDLVINFEPPYEWPTYLHRIGRAGRYGSFGTAITILSMGKEEKKFKDMLSEMKGTLNISDLWTNNKITFDDPSALVLPTEKPIMLEPATVVSQNKFLEVHSTNDHHLEKASGSETHSTNDHHLEKASGSDAHSTNDHHLEKACDSEVHCTNDHNLEKASGSEAHSTNDHHLEKASGNLWNELNGLSGNKLDNIEFDKLNYSYINSTEHIDSFSNLLESFENSSSFSEHSEYSTIWLNDANKYSLLKQCNQSKIETCSIKDTIQNGAKEKYKVSTNAHIATKREDHCCDIANINGQINENNSQDKEDTDKLYQFSTMSCITEEINRKKDENMNNYSLEKNYNSEKHDKSEESFLPTDDDLSDMVRLGLPTSFGKKDKKSYSQEKSYNSEKHDKSEESFLPTDDDLSDIVRLGLPTSFDKKYKNKYSQEKNCYDKNTKVEENDNFNKTASKVTASNKLTNSEKHDKSEESFLPTHDLSEMVRLGLPTSFGKKDKKNYSQDYFYYKEPKIYCTDIKDSLNNHNNKIHSKVVNITDTKKPSTDTKDSINNHNNKIHSKVVNITDTKKPSTDTKDSINNHNNKIHSKVVNITGTKKPMSTENHCVKNIENPNKINIRKKPEILQHVNTTGDSVLYEDNLQDFKSAEKSHNKYSCDKLKKQKLKQSVEREVINSDTTLYENNLQDLKSNMKNHNKYCDKSKKYKLKQSVKQEVIDSDEYTSGSDDSDSSALNQEYLKWYQQLKLRTQQMQMIFYMEEISKLQDY